MRCDHLFLAAEKKKACTITTERKSFGKLFWPQRKTFQAGGGYKNPIKTRKTISTAEAFLCGPHLDTRHYRAVEPPKRFRARRLRTPTCVGMRDRECDRASQSRSLSQKGSYSGREAEAEIVWHSTG